jgi:hypothetical protein
VIRHEFDPLDACRCCGCPFQVLLFIGSKCRKQEVPRQQSVLYKSGGIFALGSYSPGKSAACMQILVW